MKARVAAFLSTGLRWLAILCGLCLLMAGALPARADQVKIVALGTSFTNGRGVAPSEAYPARLEAKLRADGYDAQVLNFGVNGDTTQNILARLGLIPRDTRIVIYEYARGNDSRRGITEEGTYAASDQIIGKLVQDHFRVLLIIRDKDLQRLDWRVKWYANLVHKYDISYVRIEQPEAMLIQGGPARGHPTVAAHDQNATAIKAAIERMLSGSR